MRVVRLTAENVKRLRAVDIVPDPNFVVVSGKNHAGKSSVLDSIMLALAGGDASRLVPMPIRQGETQASVTLDLGDLTVVRTWTAKGTYLRVEADGKAVGSPQAVLDRLVGRMALDPTTLERQTPREQIATLLQAAGVADAVAAIDSERQAAYDERRDLGRDLKAAQAVLAGVAPVPDDAPWQEADAADLARALAEATATRSDNDRQRTRLKEMRADAADQADEIRSLEARIQGLREHYDRTVATGRQLAAQVDALVDPDVDGLTRQLSDIGARNALARRRREHEEAGAKVRALQAQWAVRDEAVKAADDRKAAILADAALPVEGLGYDDSGITYHGIPLAGCAASERLRVGVALALAMSPELRVVRITDGSLLDSESMAELARLAEDMDAQCWVEVVSDGEPVGIVIEDGSVREVATAVRRGNKNEKEAV